MGGGAGQQVVSTLFVSLRRSQAGKPWFHRRVLDALGLKRRLTCVEKPNNPVIRGMLRKVAHLVVIETDQMYLNRKLAERAATQLRPPVTVRHHSTPAAAAAGSSSSSGGGGGGSFAAGPVVAAASLQQRSGQHL